MTKTTGDLSQRIKPMCFLTFYRLIRKGRELLPEIGNYFHFSSKKPENCPKQEGRDYE